MSDATAMTALRAAVLATARAMNAERLNRGAAGNVSARHDDGLLITPTGMTTDQMMDGFKYVYEGFYSIANILKRFSPPPKGQLLESLAYVVANLKVNRYLRSHERAWATIS